ncbi:MAG: amidase [Chloroflexi bacterium]|nr:amidase [Chloroflexota bacterium]MCI0786452.1 amidase [Chloroflexota bacterium]MCI0798819.1 amidase [Chloroflexota bacterium]MCI0823290.1 amidase [Chloroflexota bacterium]MCI0859619.1 amidase [Chloroflexota bacterium]
MDADMAFAPATELRRLIQSKEVSIVELVELFYQRIDSINPRLNAYLALCQDQALDQARSAQDAVQRGDSLGPLHGIPISVKDLEMTKGIPTTLGSAVFRDRTPDIDSVVVERIRQAGAIILGKTNTPEFGLSGTTENKVSDPCRNPWNTERTPGGSSGGAAAALASGLCTLATGSDGGGSIRIPASFSGVFGIKPSQGRVPRYGGYGRPAANQFSQSGPLSRTVGDAALLLQVLSGDDPRDPTCLREDTPDFSADLNNGVRGWRIAWSPDLGYAGVDPEVVRVTSEAAQVFQELGAEVEEPQLVVEDPFPAFWDAFATAAYTSYGHLLPEHEEEFTDYGLRSLQYGASVSGADLSRALLRVDLLRRQMENFFDQYDLLLTPTMAVAAFPIEQRPGVIGGKTVEPFWGYLPFTFPINMTGQTASSVPCGFSADGMPIGLHLVGPHGSEAKVLQASAAFEQARPWSQKRPPVS